MRFTTASSESILPPENAALSQVALRSDDFRKISQLVYQHSGIQLNAGKEELVRSRLMKRLRALSIPSFGAYLHYVCEDRTAQELRTLIDCVTTNKTSFFRENQHFDHLRTHILPEIRKRGSRLRIWCAGCSSGEEPYSIAMMVHDQWPSIDKADVRILATDISGRMLAKARLAEYDKQSLQDVPRIYILKYFVSSGLGSQKTYTIQDKIRSLVRFARLNLMDDWPMKGPFDVIFCRNVMIYFDTSAQRRLVQRFHRLLVPGGYLLVGHSESLLANAAGFKYIRPATYMKQTGAITRIP
jgi:chemotaxis protein methyltransferase CheR